MENYQPTELKEKIEELRGQLQKLLELDEPNHKAVLAVSRELDEVINLYYKMSGKL
ncbi:MAG: aspartyl-phosphate phosphatase Spo0E family protein [Bacillota bacterium]